MSCSAGAAAAAAAAAGVGGTERRIRGGDAEKSVQSVLMTLRLMSESCDWLAAVALPATCPYNCSQVRLLANTGPAAGVVGVALTVQSV